MKFLYTDSRGKLTRTLAMVWFCLIGVMYKFIFDDLPALDFTYVLMAIWSGWLGREFTEKRKL